jgi:glutaredoxin
MVFDKTIIVAACALLMSVGMVIGTVHAQEPITIYFFYGANCPYCAQAEQHLSTFKVRNPSARIAYFETWNNEENAAIMTYVVPQFGGNASGVPRMIIGNRVISGFHEQTTPAQIDAAVSAARTLNDPNPAAAVIAQWRSVQENVAIPSPSVRTTATVWGSLNAAIVVIGGALVVVVGVTGWMAVRNRR